MAGRRSWTVEVSWKCSSCGKENRGRDMKCVECGNPKDNSEKYDMSRATSAAAVTDPGLLAQAKAGPNWECDYCAYHNREVFASCKQCGASNPDALEDGPPRCATCGLTTCPAATDLLHGCVFFPENTPESQIEREFTGGDYRNAPQVKETVRPPPPKPRAESWEDLQGEVYVQRSWTKTLTISLVVLLVLGAVGVLIWVFMPHEHEARVSSIRWQYTRTLEQRFTRSGSGWGAPPGAFNTHCESRQRGTRNCNPHDCNPHQVSYDCRPHDCRCRTSCRNLNNGYASCSETCDTCYETCYRTEYDTCYDTCPVYDNWCTYNYHEWERRDREVTSGNDHSVRWGTRLRADRSIPQRIVTSEDYTVVFSQDGETWSYRPDTLRTFNQYNVGDVWLVETNLAGMVRPLHPEPSR